MRAHLLTTFRLRSLRRSAIQAVGLATLVVAAAACATTTANNAAAPSGSASPAPAASASASPAATTKPVLPPTVLPPTILATTCAQSAGLCNSTIDVPEWGKGLDYLGCPHGKVKLTGGRYPAANPRLNIVKFLTADVDHNGDAETIVLLHCPGDPGPQQLIAVDRTRTGALVTMGHVVEEADTGVARIFDIAGHQNGSVLVRVVDRYGSVEYAYASAVFQWRAYGWDGRQFVQTAGSTSFVVDPSSTRLTITLAPVVFATPIGTQRHGTLTATVHNSGTTSAAAATIRVILDGGLIHVDQGVCTTESDYSVDVQQCPLGDIAPGSTREVTTGMTIAQADVATFVELGGRNTTQLLVCDQLDTTIDGPTVTFR